MATLILTAAGYSFAGPVGFGVGILAAAGDQMAMNSLFPPPKPKSRLGDIHLQTAEAGAEMAMLMGTEVRVGGEVVFKSAVREVEMEGGGGCGGPSVPSTYGYFADVAVAIGQPPPGQVLDSILKLFFDGRVAYSSDPDITYISIVLQAIVDIAPEMTAGIDFVSNPSGQPIDVTTEFYIGPFTFGRVVVIAGVGGATVANGTWDVASFTLNTFRLAASTGDGSAYTIGTGTATRAHKRMKIQSPSGGPDLSKFQAGYDVVVGGYTTGANNGTFMCLSSGINSTTGVSWVILDNPNVVAEAAGDSVTLFQDLPNNNPRHFSGLTLHDGSSWQLPDPTMEALLGSGKAPGMVGVAWYMLSDLNLTLFGDRIPNANAVCRVTTSWTVGQAIGAWMRRYGFDASEYEVSTLTQDCRGYFVMGAVTGQNALSSLLTTFDIVHYEEDGVVHFVNRKDIAPVVISTDELAARPYGAEAPRPFSLKPTPERTVPREVEVHYANPSKDWQGDMEAARRSNATGDNVLRLQTDVTMAPGFAQDTARRVLWTAKANQDVIAVQLPPSRSLLHEGSVIELTGHGRTWTVLARQVDYQRSTVVAIEGPNDEAAALDFTSSPADGGADDSGGPGVLAALDLIVIDVAPLSDAQATEPGVYLATAPVAPDKPWIGADAYESASGADGTFTLASDLPFTARLGIVATALQGGVSAYMIDRKNVVDVTLTYGPSPSSVTEEHMLQGKNRVLIGGELLGYVTATLIDSGAGTWRLSNLLRGLRDTEDAIDTHQAGERAVFLAGSGMGIRFVPQAIALLGSDRYYRSIPTGGIVDDYPNVMEGYDANTVRPFRVYDVRAYRDPTDSTPDVVVTWKYQSRANVHPMYPNAIPLMEATEAYEIDLLDSAGVNVSATHSATSPTTTFTTAEVVAAGYAALDPIRLDVYQIGSYVGRGRRRRVTV